MAKKGLRNYADYVQAFNEGNDRALCERFYAENVIFTDGANLTVQGRENLIAFLEKMHEGVREIDRPVTVTYDEENKKVFVEIDMEFHSTVDNPNWPLGPIRPGKRLTMKFFGLYLLDEEYMIHTLKLMAWKEGVGVTNAPRLGGDAGQRAAYMSYVSAVNAGALDILEEYYHPDISVAMPNGQTITGRGNLIKMFRDRFEKIKETGEVKKLVADDNGLVAHLRITWLALKDAPEFMGGLKAGQEVTAESFVWYELRDGLISGISIAMKG